MIAQHPLCHLKISSGSPEEMLSFIDRALEDKRKSYCIALNLTKYAFAKNDPKLRETINSADLVLADGVPIMWLGRRLGYRDVRRVTGIELAEGVLRMSARKGWRVFLLGARPEAIEKAVDSIRADFTGIEIVGFHHGYFGLDETENIVELINASGTDVLLIGLGMPQKEYFVHDNFGKIDVKFFLPVGGAFDVWAGLKGRPPALVQRAGLEWLYRSFRDRSKAINIAKYGLVFLKDLLFIKR